MSAHPLGQEVQTDLQPLMEFRDGGGPPIPQNFRSSAFCTIGPRPAFICSTRLQSIFSASFSM